MSVVGAIVKNLSLAVAPAAQPSIQAPEERSAKLNKKILITDPRWQDIDFQSKHFQLDSFIREFHKFMNGEGSAETLQLKLDGVLRSSAYKNPENKEFYDQFFRTLRTQLASLENPSNQSQAKQVLALNQLPKPEAPVATVPPPEAAPETSVEETQGRVDGPGTNIKDEYFSLGIGIESNRLAALAIRGLGFNPDGFARQQDTVVKAGVTFSVGEGDKEQVMEITAHGGGGKMTSIPGSGLGSGTIAFGGVDVGLVNPHAKNREFKKVDFGKYESAGLGLGVIGVTDHAGKGEGVPTPNAVARARFYRKSEWVLSAGQGRNYQITASTIANNQEVNFVLNNPELEAVDEEQTPVNSPFATAGNLFPTAKPNLFSLGFRWWPHGAPPGVTRKEFKEKFKPGEGLPKVFRVATGDLINFARRLNTPPAFANNRIYFGTFQPLGAGGSRTQFDRLGLGLLATSVLDGNMIAGTAKERAEVWRRGTWLDRGLMIAVDGAHLIADIALVATAKKDPTSGQTLEEFIANPGMVTDFRGRGAKIDLGLFGFGQGLSFLDTVGAFGRIYDEKKGHYIGSRAGMILLGLGMVFFSAPLSGVECGPKGTSANRCGFGTTHYKDGQFFDATPDNTAPDDIKRVQRQYMVSTIGGAASAFGISGLVDLFLMPKDQPIGHKVHPGDVARKDRVQVSGSLGASLNGANVGVSLRF